MRPAIGAALAAIPAQLGQETSWNKAAAGSLFTQVGEQSGDGSDDALANPMAINESDLKVGAVYERAGRQLRRVLRLTPRHVLYEIRTPSPPFYRVSVLRRKFAAEAMRVHGTANDLPPTEPPSKRNGNARAWRS